MKTLLVTVGIVVVSCIIFILSVIHIRNRGKNSDMGVSCAKNVVVDDISAIAKGAGLISPYDVEYKNPGMEGIEVTVKGPAAKLAVILTSPSGKAEIKIIEENDMISNCKTVVVPMSNPEEGQWTLTVKTFKPEKVVCKKVISFLFGETKMECAYIGLSPEYRFKEFDTYHITQLQIALQKAGNLFPTFCKEDSLIQINGRDSSINGFKFVIYQSKPFLVIFIDGRWNLLKCNTSIAVNAKLLFKEGKVLKTINVCGDFIMPEGQKENKMVNLSLR